MKLVFYIASLLFSIKPIDSKILISVNNSSPIYESTIKITKGEKVTLTTENAGKWVEIKPVLKEYDNLSEGIHTIKEIFYNVNEVEKNEHNKIITFSNLSPGTYYYGRFKTSITSLKSKKPIHFEHNNIVQIIVRENNSYTGVLTELLNLPFIIPPKTISDYGHQTDLCIGTDCAELAIYGMRRWGYEIPYCGPKKIYKYLNKTQNIKPGVLLHFGFQVSVLYEDKGVIGKIDKEDLLIHAFEDKVEIKEIGKTKLFHLPYDIFEWNL